MKVSELKSEIENELTNHIIPFWEGLRDDEYGGYYGWLDFDLKQDNMVLFKSIPSSWR